MVSFITEAVAPTTTILQHPGSLVHQAQADEDLLVVMLLPRDMAIQITIATPRQTDKPIFSRT